LYLSYEISRLVPLFSFPRLQLGQGVCRSVEITL